MSGANRSVGRSRLRNSGEGQEISHREVLSYLPAALRKRRLPRLVHAPADYEVKYGVAPDAIAASSYDAARILFDAIKRARSADGTAIRDMLAQTTNFHGVTGMITLDLNRNAAVPVYILRIDEGGKFTLQSSILSGLDTSKTSESLQYRQHFTLLNSHFNPLDIPEVLNGVAT